MENQADWPAPFIESAQPQREAISTRTLQLVIREEVTDTNRFFGRQEKQRLGYDVAIFRNGAYAGLIAADSFTTPGELANAYRRRVKNGDVIYAIKNGQWHLEVSDTLRTSDGRFRTYILDLSLSIVSTKQFIEQYVQYSNQYNDPVELASRAIKGFVRQVMGQMAHDHMTERDLINAALEALKYENNSAFGLSVNRADVLTFDIDPHVKALRDIQRDIEKGALEAQGSGTIDEIKARNEANQRLIAKQTDADITRLEGNVRREENSKDAALSAELEQRKLQGAIDNLIYHNQLEEARRAKEERDARHEGEIARIRANNQAHVLVTEMRDDFIKRLGQMAREFDKNVRLAVNDEGKGVEEALASSGILELLDAVDRLAGSASQTRPPRPMITPAEDDAAPDFATAPGRTSGEWSTSTGPLPGILKQGTPEDPVLLISDLGLKLIQISPGEERSQLTGLGQETAFLICACAAHSPAEQAHLQVGDILVTMNEIQLVTLNDLSQAVSAGRAGQELSFLVLRDRALIPGTIRIPR